MRKIQNSNISLRVTNDLKERLTEFSLENDLHCSTVVRQALATYLKGQRPRLMMDPSPLSQTR